MIDRALAGAKGAPKQATHGRPHDPCLGVLSTLKSNSTISEPTTTRAAGRQGGTVLAIPSPFHRLLIAVVARSRDRRAGV